MSNCGMLKSMWRAAYETHTSYKKERPLIPNRGCIQNSKPEASPLRLSTPPAKTKPKNVHSHSQIHKRYNELR